MRVIKVGAEWCSGCLVMRPRWQRIEDEMPDLETEYFDFDNDKKMVEKYGVKSGKLPCFVFVGKDGVELERVTGEPSVKTLKQIIERNLDK